MMIVNGKHALQRIVGVGGGEVSIYNSRYSLEQTLTFSAMDISIYFYFNEYQYSDILLLNYHTKSTCILEDINIVLQCFYL